MSKSLSDIRIEIDFIDNQVHDLFMRRAALVSSVTAAKKKAGLQIVHPAREARMMRRLLSRHKGVLPKSTVIRIWRELISSVSLLQTGLSVVVSSDKYWDMAKNYFGSEIPMKMVSAKKEAISEVMDRGAYFAVMPWPELIPELDQISPWWTILFNQSDKQEKLSIVCSLPYGALLPSDNRAIIISKIEFMPSDDDISFVGLELEQELSRDRIIEHANNSDITVINIFKANSGKDRQTHAYLLEVKGFIETDSKAITEFKKIINNNCLYCEAIGGYPVIPDIK